MFKVGFSKLRLCMKIYNYMLINFRQFTNASFEAIKQNVPPEITRGFRS